jgi:pSer/pThr/pTyr-binding forkhead associated (FHA) protein
VHIGLRVFHQNEELAAVRITTSIVKIGRIKSAQLQLDDPSVSRLHCILESGPLSIIDLGSTTGTRINRQNINKSPLTIGDRVDIGVFTLEVCAPEASWPTTPVTVAATVDGLPPQLAYLTATPAQPPHLPAVATPATPPQLAFIDNLFAADERAFADQIGGVMLVAIDKLREHRGREGETGKAYATMLECLATIRLPRAAPSLLIELAHGIPDLKEDWRATFAASIAQHDAMWPHLMALANLPGFAKSCALAAVTAGRDPLPWLAHPFGEVRSVAAQVIRDPDARRRACASVWASYVASDMKPRFDWRASYDAETEPLHDLPPIGALVDGLFVDCADQRAWTIEQVAKRRAPGDEYALVVADELDAARARAGWPRTRIDWSRWQVPQTEDDRAAWIRDRARTTPDAIPTSVLAQLAYAPREYPPPKLVLTEDAYEAVLDQERCEALAALTELEALAAAEAVAS